jgi:tyrosine-specific transport protein
MFVLPEAVGGVGMMTGSAIFLGLYVYNLISGLVLADVAISLHESSDCEVPSSFKDFVDTAMKSEVAGTIMAGASLISNSCFLAFGTVHAGSLLANTVPGLGLDPIVGAGGFAAMVALFSVTQTNKGLESIANAAVFVLFASFASVLLPSMAHIDPIETFRAPAVNHDGFAAAAATAVPLLLSSLTYQNIVPSIAKLLDFDRTKTTLAIAIGSFVPMVMYEAWCLAVLGGGLDNSAASGAGAAAFVAFSASALVGSSVAAVMSLAEEYESILTKVVDQDDSCPLKNKFSVPAVALSMAPPVALALAYSNGGDLTCALHFNGAFITPFLYGLLPVLLHQRVTETEEVDGISLSSLPQVLLGAGAIGALGQAVVQDVSNIIA